MPGQPPRQPVWPVATTILSLLTAAATGFGTWVLAGVVEVARADIIGAAGAAPPLPVSGRMFLLGLGSVIFGMCLSTVVAAGASDTLSDRFGRPIIWAGATVGAVVAARAFRMPAQVGVGDVTDPDQPWEWYQWGLYALPVVVPVLLSLKLVFSIWRVARRISELRLRAYGQFTRATVTHVHFRHMWHFDRPMFRVTFAFSTPTGRRTATRRLTTTPEEAPIVGGTVRVWYDPDDPDPERLSMDRDPDSPVDPENARRYAPPPD